MPTTFNRPSGAPSLSNRYFYPSACSSPTHPPSCQARYSSIHQPSHHLPTEPAASQSFHPLSPKTMHASTNPSTLKSVCPSFHPSIPSSTHPSTQQPWEGAEDHGTQGDLSLFGGGHLTKTSNPNAAAGPDCEWWAMWSVRALVPRDFLVWGPSLEAPTLSCCCNNSAEAC